MRGSRNGKYDPGGIMCGDAAAAAAHDAARRHGGRRPREMGRSELHRGARRDGRRR